MDIRELKVNERNPRYAQVIVTRMKRLDPDINIFINNKPYKGK